MEKTYNPALIQRTQRYMETHSISQNQFAAKVNLSSAALSSYLNQKYKGSVEAVERQLSEFFKLDEEAEAPPRRPPVCCPRAAYVRPASARMSARASALPSWSIAWSFCTVMRVSARARAHRSSCATIPRTRWASASHPARAR